MKMMFGKHKEYGVWIARKNVFKIMFFNHPCLYIAFFKFRLRIVKP